MRWQFTVYGYGSDLGADNRELGSTPIVDTSDKEKLTFRVAQINGMADKEQLLAQVNNQASYDGAIAVLKGMESTQAQVDRALVALNQLEAKLPGDANGDGVVNVTDLSIVKKNFGQEVTPGQLGDVDNNGIVNVTDLSIVKKNFGKR
ncbi:dockerin type I repeat-containing protein [Eubacterium aggregans]|uniref:dockerin type I repeat-containing protein n=1 Tax=Eubacterium aggregans TaxID=81409 RepID=UPI003F37A751